MSLMFGSTGFSLTCFTDVWSRLMSNGLPGSWRSERGYINWNRPWKQILTFDSWLLDTDFFSRVKHHFLLMTESLSCRLVTVSRRRRRRKRSRKKVTHWSEEEYLAPPTASCINAKDSGSSLMDCMSAGNCFIEIFYVFTCKYLNRKFICNFKIKLFSVFGFFMISNVLTSILKQFSSNQNLQVSYLME